MKTLFSAIYKLINMPILVALLIATWTGKLVIRITGVQLSIGLTILVILLIFAVMVFSFLFGISYLVVLAPSFILKVKMPLPYRIATKLIVKPLVWVLGRFFATEEDKKDLADSKSALEKYQQRVGSELERIHNEPPASTTK